METAEPEQLHRDLEELITQGYARMYIDREPALALIRARDNATRLAAKLEGANEVLDELARVAGEMRWNDDRQMLTGIYKMLRLKCQAAEAQPVTEKR